MILVMKDDTDTETRTGVTWIVQKGRDLAGRNIIEFEYTRGGVVTTDRAALNKVEVTLLPES